MTGLGLILGLLEILTPEIPIQTRLGVKATTCKAKDLTFKAKDLTFKAKAKDLIPEGKVGYQNKY